MTTILFLDSDSSALDHLSEWCSQNRPQWQTLIAESVEPAIELANNLQVDCVVSNLELPANSGVELLRHMTHTQPQAVRIGLSAAADAELTMESLHMTHRFVSKCAEVHIVCDAIERSLTLHQHLSDSKLKAQISEITTLPVLPEIYDRFMLELASENFSIENIGRIIESDISLTATLLRIVNSPYYGMVTHVQSPTHAVNLLGVELIKNILLADSIASQIKQNSPAAKRINELNSQACIRGILANRLSRLARLNKRQIDHCQMAAMLSTLGELVLESSSITTDPVTGSQFNPDLIGSYILELWSLPDAIKEAVLHQNRVELPGSNITAMHVLRVIRLLENADITDVISLEESIRKDTVFKDLQIDHALLSQWINCYNDYHTELRFAA